MLDLDSFKLDSTCPRCGFLNDFTIKEVRLRDVVICRGCHSNVKLDDQLNTVRWARTSLKRATRGLDDALKSLGDTITLEF